MTEEEIEEYRVLDFSVPNTGLPEFSIILKGVPSMYSNNDDELVPLVVCAFLIFVVLVCYAMGN